MNTNEVLNKLLAEIDNIIEMAEERWDNEQVTGAKKLRDLLGARITSLQQEQQKTDIKSPFTGGNVAILSKEEELTFRGEKIKITRKYYRCEDTGREFTDSKLDDDMMWDTFRAYCEKKGITSFTDIVLRQELPEVELEKITPSLVENMLCEFGVQSIEDMDSEILAEFARHFYELGRARKEQPKVDIKMRTCDKLEMEKLYGEE